MSSPSPTPPPGNDQASLVERALEGSSFASRWLQAPLYTGLIVAQMIYVCQFMRELWHPIAVFLGPGTVNDVSSKIMIAVRDETIGAV